MPSNKEEGADAARRKLSLKDVLLWSKGDPPKPGPRRIGIHTSTAGGVAMAAERAYRLGANAYLVKPAQASQLVEMVTAIYDFWLKQNTPQPSPRMELEAVPATERAPGRTGLQCTAVTSSLIQVAN